MTPYVWAQDRRNEAEHQIRRALITLSQEVHKRAEACPDKGERKRLYATATALQQRGALTKALPELEAHPAMTLRADDFDADDWLLNTPAGIVDLRTGEVRPSDPAALMSKSTRVAPDFEATPTMWLDFLRDTTGGDDELQAYLQKLAGYALTGSTQEQILAFIHGPPLTGKSVFTDTLAGIFGSYHETAAADTFAATKGDRHPADLAKMAGARLVTAVETQEGRAWDTQRVKVLTGGDRVAARFMHKDFFEYRPRYQIVIVGNHEPEIKGVDDAMMRRLHVIPFEHRPEAVDRLLAEKLKDEWPAILAWAIQGCLLWVEQGLGKPTAVEQRTTEYRKEEDPVGLFLEECCEMDAEASISRRDLYTAWCRWCHQQGEDAGTLKQLRRRFRSKEKEHGFRDGRVWDGTTHRRGYTGIRLTNEDDGMEGFEV